MQHLTLLEQKALLAFETNYSNAELEKQDNATFADVFEIADHIDHSIATTKGVMGSLVKKGLVAIDPPRYGGVEQCFILTDEGIEAHYSLK